MIFWYYKKNVTHENLMSAMITAIVIYIICFIFIIIEHVDKAVIAISGALLMILFKIITPEEAIEYIDFETILLLMGMMMIVDITQRSHIFSWISTKFVGYTRGNPLLIFFVFMLFTAIFSAFFDNVTTILIIVPITIAVTKRMGLDPKLYVISEIMFSNIGGALTLIGDPPNILIGSTAKLSFNDFIINLWMPVLASIIFIGIIMTIVNWKKIKPFEKNLLKLFTSQLLIRKIHMQFCKEHLEKKFILTSVIIVTCIILSFIFQKHLDLTVGIIAMIGAMVLLMSTTKYVQFHETLSKVEWPTLFFFMGLFMLTGGLEKTGFLELISHYILNLTDNFTILVIIVLWLAGLVSMIFDNIPFVAVMIPVIMEIQLAYPNHPHIGLLWWALSLGACFGGNGTLIGASANVVGAGLAQKNNVQITFLGYMKTAFPLTLITLVLSTIYLLYRLSY